MSGAPSLDERVVELESRLAFQEHALSELSDALADARALGERQALRLQQLVDDLRQLRGSMLDSQGEQAPPHY